MALKVWLAIAGRSLLALAGEVVISFPFAFNPGWANGWPLGLTIYSVWPAGMSFVFFLLLLTTAVGMGAVIGAACSYFGVDQRRGRSIFVVWLACSFVLAFLASLWAFREIQASTLEMWPNGYNP
jgi:hypothetical protein